MQFSKNLYFPILLIYCCCVSDLLVSCNDCTYNDYYVQCDDKIDLTVNEPGESKFIKIECKDYGSTLDVLLPMVNEKHKVEYDITQVIIVNCQLSVNVSIKNVLNKSKMYGYTELVIHGSDLPDETILSNLTEIKDLHLEKCIIDNIDLNFVEFFPNLKKLTLHDNKLTEVDMNFTDKLEQLLLIENKITKITNLNANRLNYLKLTYNNLTELHSTTFEKLENLQKLVLDNNNLTNLPEKLFNKNKQLQSICLRNNQSPLSIPSGFFSNLSKLEEVNLLNSKIYLISSNAFHNSSAIKIINLTRNKLDNLTRGLFDDQENLEVLILNRNNIESIENQLLRNNVKLKQINITNNKLTKINDDTFATQQNLTSLNLVNNNIVKISPNAFINNPHLEQIDISNNRLTLNYNPFTLSNRLKKLNLHNNSIPYFFIGNYNLEEVDLSNNKVNDIDLFDSCYTDKNIKIDLRNNNIHRIHIDRVQKYKDVTHRYLLDNNPIFCDCHLIEFIDLISSNKTYDSLMKYEFDMENLFCNDTGKKVKDLKSEELLCNMTSWFNKNNNFTCPNKCDCKYRKKIDSLIVDCQNQSLQELPRLANLPKIAIELIIDGNNFTSLTIPSSLEYKNLSRISAGNNQLTTFTIEQGLPKLTHLILDNNYLTSMNGETILNLKNSSNLKEMSLLNNLWSCDCDADNFVKFLKENSLIGNTTCQNGDSFVLLNTEELCKVQIMRIHIIGFVGLISIFVALCIGIYFKYNLEIRVLLYHYKINLIFRDEDELDCDKPYDAFISCAEEDKQFVVDYLLPGLEGPPHYFKIFFIQRDHGFIDQIIVQMTQAIEQSRRTIVVLSPAFLESMWKVMEFRTAHSNAIDEGRSRVIAIMYKDILKLKDELDSDMKAYLKTYSYIRLSNKWFWKKLLYAMPHRKRSNIIRL